MTKKELAAQLYEVAKPHFPVNPDNRHIERKVAIEIIEQVWKLHYENEYFSRSRLNREF